MVEKRLRKYLIPNIFAMVGMSCYILADTFFISVSAGANGITALNLSLPIYGIMFAIGSMIATGSATKYSLLNAAGNESAKNYFTNSIFWSLLISLIFVFMGIFIPDAVLKIMGADETILNTGLTYIKTALLFAPFFMLNYTFTAFVRNDNAPNIAMAATLSSSIFNIIFDYIFMFPMKMGMFGAALATGLAPIVSMLICMGHYLSKKNTIHLVKKLPSVSMLFGSCSLGISAFVGEISNAVTNIVFNYILLSLIGNIAVAAYGVVANISLVCIAIFNAIAQGLQPMASEAEGINNENMKKRVLKHSLKVGIVLAIILIILLWLFSKQITAVFNSEKSVEMANYAVTGLKIYCLGFPIAAVNIVNAGFFSATGRAKECSVISISRGIAAIAVFAFVLSRFLGIYGVWLAFPAAEIFTLIITLIIQKIKKAA